MSDYAAKLKGYGTNASAGHLDYWLESVQDSSLIHAPSKTVQGGECGVVWVALALIKSLLNAAVTALGVTPPTPASTGIKLERFGNGEFYKLRDSFGAWRKICSDSLATLSKTSNERIHVADPEPVSTPAQVPLLSDAKNAPEPKSTSALPKKGARNKRTQSSEKKKTSSKGKSRSFSEMNKSDSEESVSTDKYEGDTGKLTFK